MAYKMHKFNLIDENFGNNVEALANRSITDEEIESSLQSLNQL